MRNEMNSDEAEILNRKQIVTHNTALELVNNASQLYQKETNAEKSPIFCWRVHIIL